MFTSLNWFSVWLVFQQNKNNQVWVTSVNCTDNTTEHHNIVNFNARVDLTNRGDCHVECLLVSIYGRFFSLTRLNFLSSFCWVFAVRYSCAIVCKGIVPVEKFPSLGCMWRRIFPLFSYQTCKHDKSTEYCHGMLWLTCATIINSQFHFYKRVEKHGFNTFHLLFRS